MANNNNKVKGLLKGLRYISQIFENEKEPEMQIGLPTDVKHVAHIGWDGPSVNNPSWMNEFKQAGGGYSSAPLNPPGDLTDHSQDRKIDAPDLPRSSRRHSSTGAESPTTEKLDKPRQTRRSSRNANKDSANGTRSSRHQKALSGGGEPGSLDLPDIPKKSRRKKSKDSSSVEGSSTRSSRSKSQANDQADTGSESGSVSKSSIAMEQCNNSAFTNLEGDEEK